MPNQRPKVLLIGGAPMIGKSTISRCLAARWGYGCLSIDDIGQAINVVTEATVQPAFHYMDGWDFREYYIANPLEKLIVDAQRYGEALWPALARIIANHAAWGHPIVIEGWALYPQHVADVLGRHVDACWLVAGEEVLERRIHANTGFTQEASNPAVMIRQFCARSRWYDAYIRTAATATHQHIIEVDGADTVDEVLARCLAYFERST